ncbi:MAG: TIM barrel protein [Planctomycetes bacterium]|nr:TIM barrel protein [Planctomycetota bacterium]
MKLSLLSFQLGKDMNLDKLLEVVTNSGIPGIEFRAELDHKHGVELDTTPAQRAEVRKKCEDAGVSICCIATGCKFQSMEETERQENVDRGKRFVDLAHDVGAPRIRVFGDRFGENDKNTVVHNVGDCLRQLGEHAEGSGVDVCLEMHGDFYNWTYAKGAIEVADHPRVGIVHNCDPREAKDGPVKDSIDQVKGHIRHVHIHDLESGKYPYKEFFAIMKSLGYRGFMSLECRESLDAERVIGLYAALFREMVVSA